MIFKGSSEDKAEADARSVYVGNVNYFQLMVYSVNLYHMFLFFELIFLPSLYFVYTTGYSKKVDKAIFYLLLWTYSGSFVVLLGLCYLYATYQTGNIAVLAQQSFSIFERSFLFWIFFLGFGVKVPVWPFHY